MPIKPGTRIGPYEVTSPLGEGGMGVVFRAHDTKLQREVALKLLPDHFEDDPDRLSRFQREAQLLASLNHPNIAQIYGLEQSGNRQCIVMELVEGDTLEERLRRGPIPIDETLHIAKQIVEALEAAHERGIIHRDLKPANVKITREHKVKVLDFGLARAIENAPANAALSNSPTMLSGTMGGVILGTAAYMSPEQARGRPVDKRADIWAFGVVLCEMITHKPLFRGDDVSEILASVIKDEPNLSSIPPQVRVLVERCLKKDPSQRMRDIGEARIALQNPAPLASSAEVADRPRPFAVALPWILAGIVTVVLIALASVHFREALPAERVLRASISLLPEGASIASFALSPDGRLLVIALNGEGRRELWLRPLDSQRFQLLPETNGAQYPFWSPDSRTIGFFSAGRLKTIPSTGGPPQSLCDYVSSDAGGAGGSGGSWSRDGVILFAGGTGSPIRRVSAAGGACTTVTKTEDGVSHRFPEFLPDGKHFLYFLDGGNESKQGIYLATLDSPSTASRILADRSSVVFSPRTAKSRPDHLLFLRDNNLMAQPFNADTLQLVGDVFLVTTQAAFSTTGTFRQVAASVGASGVLAYLANRTTDSQLVWIDRSGKDLEKVIPRGPQRTVTLSPDGKTAAVGSAEGLWLHDLIRGVQSRFTSPALIGATPVWSPDGAWIAFSSANSVFLKDASGAGEPMAILQSANSKTLADWSHDGRKLLYTELDPRTKADLWILAEPLNKAKEPKPSKLFASEANESMGQFSPDDRWIAYVSDESGQDEVYVRPVSGSGKWKISSRKGTQPRWRRDGKELYFMEAGPRYQWMSVPIQNGTGSAFAAGEPKPLFIRPSFTSGAPSNRFSYTPAPDGQRLLVNTPADPLGTLNVITNWERGVSASKEPE